MNTSLRLNRGVTLMELMIVMSIIGILSAIAIPSYVAYTVRTNRAAARACLSEAAQLMERIYTTNMTYVGAEARFAPTALGCQTESGLDTRYSITAGAPAGPDPTQRTFTLIATPINAQATRDTQCGVLTLDQLGTRTESGSGTLAQCW